MIPLLVSFILFTSVFALAAKEDAWITVNVTDESIKSYGGRQTDWRKIPNKSAYKGIELMSSRANHKIKFTFTGYRFRWLGSKGPGMGKADIYHNNQLLASGIDLYSKTRQNQAVIYDKELNEGTHTIKIVPTGKKNESAFNSIITVDAFQYLPSLTQVIDKANKALNKASSAPANTGDKLVRYHTDNAKSKMKDAIDNGIMILENKNATKEDRFNGVANLIDAIEEFESKDITPVIPDLSDNGYNAIPFNSPVWIEGKLNKAIYLDGEKDYLSLSRGFLEGEKQLTIEAWIKPETTGGAARILANDSKRVFDLIKNPMQGTDSGLCLRLRKT